MVTLSVTGGMIEESVITEMSVVTIGTTVISDEGITVVKGGLSEIRNESVRVSGPLKS